MTYEDILKYIKGLETTQTSYDDMNVFNPNETTAMPVMRAPSNINWGAVPGFEKFYSYDQANNQEKIDPRVAEYAKELGYTMMRGDDKAGQASAEWLRGPDGKDIAESVRITGTNDDNFKVAAALAAALAGGAAYSASGVGGAAGAGGGGYSAADMGLGTYGAGGEALGGGTASLGASGGGYSAADMGLGSYAAGGGSTIPAAANTGLGSVLSGTGLDTVAKIGTTLLGAYAGSQPTEGETATNVKTLDPRIDSRVFGEDGVLSNMDSWYKANKSGQNETMVNAQNWLRGLLQGPQVQDGLQSLYGQSSGLLNYGVAPNPYRKG